MGIEFWRSELDALTFRDWISVANDDVSGAETVPELVVEARAEEMMYFKKMKVYDIVPESGQTETGGKIIGTMCVDVNKGETVNLNCTSRLVGREFNVGRDDSVYAATPPLEALRMVLSNAATKGQGQSGR